MILTCPDCSTRYSVKDGSIGPNGRSVRCASCNATWFVSQQADELALADLQTPDMETVDPVIDPPAPLHAPRAPSRMDTSTSSPEFASEPERSERSFGAPLAPGAHVEFRDKVDRQRRNSRLLGVSMIWIVTLGLLGTAGVLGYAFRQPIVERNPAMASLYKIFNIEVTEDGLQLEQPATRYMTVDGRPVVVVNGTIINRSKKAVPIRMVELSFRNNAADVVAKWLVEPSQTELGPGERLEYVSQYPNPPVDAVEVSFKFVDDTEVSSEVNSDDSPALKPSNVEF